ncbi:uncharacterized protein LOC106096310 [Stomoxys calcitrans]|uniref:uncharacterized protein LOC106096310 n=1 Tax=Stomoxys calcitrans TaxID=35570 RepID=UPI0027E3276D|nr:uncharacterized protein LOC106096310 [Stomoxys calcitrans]
MSSTKYFLAVAIFVTLAASAFAVRCYQCSSLQDPKCGEHFENNDMMKIDCNRVNAPYFLLQLLSGTRVNATGCMKQTLTSTYGGASHILRSCYFGDIRHTDTGCQIDPTNTVAKQTSCNVCSDDYCNSSSSMAPMALAIVAFFGLARILIVAIWSILATLLIDVAWAIECYQCESAQNSKCGSRFEPDESMKIECTSAPRYLKPYLESHSKDATGCMKQIMESKLGGIHTVRSCYYGDLANKNIGCQIDPTNVFMTLDSCYVCDKDWCNASSAKTPVAVVILSVLCFVRFMS